IAASRSAGAWIAGIPPFTWSMWAPAAACAWASERTRSITPSFISAARTLRPVGLMRSPMITNGRSPDTTISRPREDRRVSTELTLSQRLVDFHHGLLERLSTLRSTASIADELFGHPRRHRGVWRVAVGADVLCVLLRDAGCDQHLGDEEVALLEPAPDLLEGGDERLEEDVHRVHAQPESLFCERFDLGRVAVERVLEQLRSDLFLAAHRLRIVPRCC